MRMISALAEKLNHEVRVSRRDSFEVEIEFVDIKKDFVWCQIIFYVNKPHFQFIEVCPGLLDVGGPDGDFSYLCSYYGANF